MGKTVAAILLVAVIIAVNVIPGVGQAISATLISAGLATTATAASLATTITTLVTSAALSAATALLAPTPKFNPPETTATPIKTPLPERVSAYGEGRLFGAYVLYANTTYSVNSDSFSPWALDAFAIHDGPVDSIIARYLGDKLITLGTSYGAQYVAKLPGGAYGDFAVKWYETLGATPGTANWPEFYAKLPTNWSATHRGDGVVMVGVVWKPVSSDEFGTRFPSGAAPASVAGRWQRVYDPRQGGQSPSDPTTWTWSDNPVLHLLHYRLVREKARKSIGAALPTGPQLLDAWNVFFAPTVAYWITAANVCDEAIPLKAGGTEKRYRAFLAHKHTDPHKDVIDGLTQTFDGWTSPRGDGAIVVFAGKYVVPTVTIGPDQIVSYSWQYGIADEESLNELKITYISALHDYNPVDAEPWVDTAAIAARGRVRTQGIDFSVPSHGQARRLAKRVFARVMAADRGIVTTNVAGRIARGQRYVYLKIIEAGTTFFDGVAEITGMTRNLSSGGVTFSWVAIGPNIDAWNPATEEGDPAPLGAVTALAEPPAPTIDSAIILYDNPADTGTGARAVISLSGPSGDDLIWYARWRVVGDPVWNEQKYTDVDSSGGVALVTGFIPVNELVEVQVAYEGGNSALSGWSFPATNVNSSTVATPPGAAGAITLLGWTSSLSLSTPPIARATAYRWRFYNPADLATPVRTKVTSVPQVDYSKAEAAADGLRRDYRVRVDGQNAAGYGTATLGATITNAAPAAVTGVAAADGTTTSTITFTPLAGVADLAGYLVAWSTAAGFNPSTQGSSLIAGASPAYTSQLPAGTYYAKVAAFDTWSSNPSLLNFSAEDSFVISTGVGTAPGGDGGGGTGGGGGFGGGGGGGIEV